MATAPDGWAGQNGTLHRDLRLAVSLTTHDAGDVVTENDIEMAAAINGLLG